MERGGRKAGMYRRYLTLTSQKGNPIPQVVNWYGKLDVRNVNRKDYKKYQRRCEKEESVSYYCPVLAEDSDGGKEALYRIKCRESYEIRICEELAESLLERGAVGMELGE